MKKEDLLILAVLAIAIFGVASIVYQALVFEPLGLDMFYFKQDPENGQSEASTSDLASSELSENDPINNVLEDQNKTVYGGPGK